MKKNNANTRSKVPVSRAKPKAPTLEELADDVEAVEVETAAQGYRIDAVEDDVSALTHRVGASEDLLQRVVRAVKALRKAAPRG